MEILDIFQEERKTLQSRKEYTNIHIFVSELNFMKQAYSSFLTIMNVGRLFDSIHLNKSFPPRNMTCNFFASRRNQGQ